MRLSKNFSLSEFLVSQTAERFVPVCLFPFYPCFNGIINIDETAKRYWFSACSNRCPPSLIVAPPMDANNSRFIVFTNSSVSYLFALCGPFTIFLGITNIIILSIKRIFRRWFWSHVLIKRFKAIYPQIANRNSSSSVMMKARNLLVITSLLHQLPSRIFRGGAFAVFDFHNHLRQMSVRGARQASTVLTVRSLNLGAVVL